MNPRYLGITEGLEFVTLFGIAPALALVVAYKEWRDKNSNLKKSGLRCLVSGGVAFLYFGLEVGWGVDVRSPQFFVRLTCSLLSFLLLGAFMGYGFGVMLGLWRWHGRTKLKSTQ
jgi:hypothetical protein